MNREIDMYTFDDNIVSDLHKDAYGCRPGEYFWSSWTSSSDAKKQVIWDNLIADLDREMEREREAQAAAIVSFEKRILDTMSVVVSADRGDVIRYFADMEDCNDDLEYLEYRMGIPYGYITKEFGRFVKKAA